MSNGSEPSKESQVAHQIKTLADLQTALAGVVDRLGGRLEPALMPSTPTPEVPQKEQESLCKIAEACRAIGNGFQDQINRIDGLISRLEI